jgi:co-chaperonin GroES (HSP10)
MSQSPIPADTDIVVVDALGDIKENVPAGTVEEDHSAFTFEDERVAAAVPQPTGYQLLVVPVEPEKKTEGGIIKAAETVHNEKVSAVVGQVIRMGADAYADTRKFPNGPYCQVGDWVIFHAYSGTRIMVAKQEFRLLDDDSVKAVVKDPRLITRA